MVRKFNPNFNNFFITETSEGRIQVNYTSVKPLGSAPVYFLLKLNALKLVPLPTASGGLRAEVLKNNSIYIFWYDPPKISTGHYYFEVRETKSISRVLSKRVPAINFTGVRFENLKAYTNYSIKAQAYQESKWITLAFVTNHTFPESKI